LEKQEAEIRAKKEVVDAKKRQEEEVRAERDRKYEEKQRNAAKEMFETLAATQESRNKLQQKSSVKNFEEIKNEQDKDAVKQEKKYKVQERQ